MATEDLEGHSVRAPSCNGRSRSNNPCLTPFVRKYTESCDNSIF